MNRESLKNALEGLDPALTDEILEKRADAEASRVNTPKPAPGIRRLAFAAAAVLLLAAVLIPVGILTKRGGVTPPDPLPDPVRAAAADPAAGSHYFVKNDYLTGIVPADQNEPKEMMALEGMRVFRSGGRDLLALNYGFLCDPATGQISRSGDVNNFVRYYRGGAADGETLYFPGRFLGCVVSGAEEEHNGIFSCPTDFSEVSPVLLSDYRVCALALHGGYLWFAEYSGSRHIVYRDENGGGGEWDCQTINVYRADFETGEIRLMLDTGCRMAYDQTLIAADDGLWLAVVYIDPDDGATERYAVLHMTYDGEYSLSPLPDSRACLCLCEGSIYAYSPYWLTAGDRGDGPVVPRTYLYLIRENAAPKLLFSDDSPFPGAARIVGANGDLPVIYRGKLVVFRDDRLCLRSLSTGAETEILSGLDLAGRAITGDGGMFLDIFSKTVLDGKLYFRVIPSPKLGVGEISVYDGADGSWKQVSNGKLE